MTGDQRKVTIFIIKITLEWKLQDLHNLTVQQTRPYDELFRRLIPKHKYTDIVLTRCLG